MHKDPVLDTNLNNWKAGVHPYQKRRPGLVTQDYTDLLDNTGVTMMSPYGGGIYVTVRGNRLGEQGGKFECNVTFKGGVIEMPYFVQGTYIALLFST